MKRVRFFFLPHKRTNGEINKWGDKMTAGIYRNISQFFIGKMMFSTEDVAILMEFS